MKISHIHISILFTLVFLPLHSQAELKVHLSWGHESDVSHPFFIQLQAENVEILDVRSLNFDEDDRAEGMVWETHAGGGDIDGVEFSLSESTPTERKIENLHSIWADLIKMSDEDTARRLQMDPAYRLDDRKITVRMNREGTLGFSVTVDQLVQNQAFWIPSFNVYLSTGEDPISYEDHRRDLEARDGKRILESVQDEPEATYEQYSALWEDMGSPSYKHSHQPEPGHIVGLTWDSAIPKFGIDRGAGVWNDYGNPDRFRFWYHFGDLSNGIERSWQGQHLLDGLPILTTQIEEDGIRYEVEQFAYPLIGPPQERRGDISMVLLQKVKISNRSESDKTAPVKIYHRRQFPSHVIPNLILNHLGNQILFENGSSERILFSLEGDSLRIGSHTQNREELASKDGQERLWHRFEVEIPIRLRRGETREFFVKLPSPVVGMRDRKKLAAVNYSIAREETLKFWSDSVERGAQFHVPEKVVNDLFRANLWHALRLPRRHGGEEAGVRIDIPYSNFAYDQDGIPWPINQAVYVDYMLYDLRGYHEISKEELLAIYRTNQETDGHIKGYANWGVYTPAMIFVTAKHFLLTQDRETFYSLLPYALKSMDWCLKEIEKNSDRQQARGLIRAPLNDLTGEGVWAFTQAYIYAGLSLFGKALERIEHPRANECKTAAEGFQQAVIQAYSRAMVQSPLVQLRDHTWIPYVPCEAMTPGRLFEQWYPTDVDTGAVHLLRLNALPAEGLLADALLHDHEDNLFLHGWGMANEPVYNQQATAYLLRDDAKAVIRAFYSYMACAFSHSALEPVEHRWSWGQYFGPPSTDGAWFELYRNMLIHERDDNTLILMQATPRKWMEDGKKIEVKRAPTYYGEISLTSTSQSATGRISVELEMSMKYHPHALYLRLRHPEAKRIRSVTVNNREWKDFDPEREWIRIENPSEKRYEIIAIY